jgi:glycosyltransferase involved in cell wall biosynthesis
LVLSVWGSDINTLLTPEADARTRAVVGQALASADLVLADAPDMVEKCAQLAGRPVPVDLLPLGIDTGLFRPCPPETVTKWRSRLSIPEDATVFVTMRAMAPLYGHHLILDAFAEAARRIRVPPVLVFKLYNQAQYRTSGDYLASIQRRAAELNISHLLRWVDTVSYDELPEIYSFADAVVNYPSMDAFPVTFLEAAACQCPVISVALPAYKATFAEAFFRIVPPGDPNAFRDALVDYGEGGAAAARSRLGAARELMQREYDESVSAQRLLEHYRRLAHRKHNGVPAAKTRFRTAAARDDASHTAAMTGHRGPQS